MKLTLQDLLAIRAGLEALDGYERIIKEGSNEKTARVLYQLGGSMRLSIAKSLNAVQVELIAYQKARQDLIKQYANGGPRVPDNKMLDFIQEDRNMLDAEVEIDIKPIKVADLKLDENPVPPTVLSTLVPILEE